jgi:hypothetical protein
MCENSCNCTSCIIESDNRSKIGAQDGFFKNRGSDNRSSIGTQDVFFKSPCNGTSIGVSKSKLCMYYKVGCTIEGCHYAHSVEEIQPIQCIFGHLCKKMKCQYFHPGQTITKESLLRQGLCGTKLAKRKPKVIVNAEKVVLSPNIKLLGQIKSEKSLYNEREENCSAYKFTKSDTSVSKVEGIISFIEKSFDTSYRGATEGGIISPNLSDVMDCIILQLCDLKMELS